jgi:hypothetical protein
MDARVSDGSLHSNRSSAWSPGRSDACGGRRARSAGRGNASCREAQPEDHPRLKARNVILGYPQQTTVSPGEVLTLHVSTDAPSFRADFSRQEAAIVSLFSSDWLPGQLSPMPTDGGTDCAWPAFAFPIPADWPTGAYSVAFVEGDGQGGVNPAPTPPPPAPNANADQADVFGAFFVVRPPAPSAAILYKVPLFTYHAYNTTGGSSLYEQNGAHTVTLLRPGGGIGAYYRHGDVPDAYDPASRRQTFAHWDAKFISWLYANQVYPDFCTDLDVHQDPHLTASIGRMARQAPGRGCHTDRPPGPPTGKAHAPGRWERAHGPASRYRSDGACAGACHRASPAPRDREPHTLRSQCPAWLGEYEDQPGAAPDDHDRRRTRAFPGVSQWAYPADRRAARHRRRPRARWPRRRKWGSSGIDVDTVRA